MQTEFRIPASMSDILQGIILFCVLGANSFYSTVSPGRRRRWHERLWNQVTAFLYAAILASVPLLYGTLGEILTQKAGNINLGVEGMMYLGAIIRFPRGFTRIPPFMTLLSRFAGRRPQAPQFTRLSLSP